MRYSRLIPGLLAATLAAGACTSDDPTQDANTNSTDLKGQDITLTSALSTEDSCDALLGRLIDLGLERVGPYGYGNGDFYPVLFDEAMTATTMQASADADESAAFAENDSAGAAEATGGSFSGTNNQEGGVDEADFVKTDGKRLVVLNANTVRVIDTTGDSPELVHTIKMQDNLWVSELFLVGDRALVMSQGWVEEALPNANTGEEADWGVMPSGTSTTSLTEIDLISGTVGETITFEGVYLSGREVDGSIRVVINSGVGQFPFVYANGEAAEEAAEKTNRELLKQSTIEQWLPGFRLSDGSAGSLVPCDQMYIPGEFSGFGTLAVLTLDVSEGLRLNDSLGVLTEGQTIYASTDRLAVSTTRWEGDFNWEEGIPADQETYITSFHSFDISDPSTTSYVASGSVEGYLLNQYSMSEFEGYLRVAVTEGAPWGDQSSQSSVIVLEEQGSELVTVGEVGGLGKGEQIMAVRFMGDTAYVVTFRQIDPLYVVDLSDPTNPSVAGELKIPGFSAYLHPIGAGQLVGVGQDGTQDGRITGAQVSLFDVANPANPTRIDSLAFGENSQSTVAWEAKAFTWWAPTQTAFVPINAWNWDQQTGTESNSADMVAVRVDANGSLSEIGRISHPAAGGCESGDYYIDEEPIADGDAEASLIDSEESVAPEGYCWSYQPEIRRSVIIDDTVYTVSESGVMASSLSDFSERGWVPFN